MEQSVQGVAILCLDDFDLSEGISRRVTMSKSAVLGDERVQNAGKAGNTVPTLGASRQTRGWLDGDPPPGPNASDELQAPSVFCAEHYSE